MKSLILISVLLFSCSPKTNKKKSTNDNLILSIEISRSHEAPGKKYSIELAENKINKYEIKQNNKELIGSFSLNSLFVELSNLTKDWPEYTPKKTSQKISLYSSIVLVFSSGEKKYIRLTAEKLNDPENFELFRSKFNEFLNVIELTL